MNARIWVSAVLLAAGGMSWAQRPLVYPLRSQSPSVQSVDNAYCYWQAKEQTHVDVAREPQKPVRTEPIAFAPDAGRGASAPPLPVSAGQVRAASGTAAANAAPPAAGTAGLAGASAAAASTASGTREASATSGVRNAPNMTATSDSASSGASGGSVGLPPLPPPEPPMTRYWHAYGDCMQSRGYGVR